MTPTNHNIYRYALQVGNNKIGDGITFNEMTLQLKGGGFSKFDKKSFMNWFFSEFSLHVNYNDTQVTEGMSFPAAMSKGMKDGVVYEEFQLEKFTNTKAYMKAEGLMRLLEFEELEEAREASLQANENAQKSSKEARNAFIVSIIALILSLVFSIIGIVSDNNPKTESSKETIIEKNFVPEVYLESK